MYKLLYPEGWRVKVVVTVVVPIPAISPPLQSIWVAVKVSEPVRVLPGYKLKEMTDGVCPLERFRTPPLMVRVLPRLVMVASAKNFTVPAVISVRKSIL